MAYLSVINRPCAAIGCTSRATREVFGRDRTSDGVYCRHCAILRVRELERDETTQDRTARRTGSIPVVLEEARS